MNMQKTTLKISEIKPNPNNLGGFERLAEWGLV